MIKAFTLPVSVAKCDIRHGVPRNCSKCPIARRVQLAVTQRFRRWDKVSVFVGGETVGVSYRDGRGKRHKLSAKLPASGNAFIGQFDRLERVRVKGKRVVDTNHPLAPNPFNLTLDFIAYSPWSSGS